MKAEPLYIFILSFVVGISIYSIFDLGVPFIFLTLLLSVASLLFYKLKNKRIYFFASLIFCAATLGMLRLSVSDFVYYNPQLDVHIDEQVVVEGVVIDEVDEREKNTRLTVRLDTLSDEILKESTKAIVVVDRYPEFKYGDRLKIKGNLTKPENFKNENGREFDYVSYLAKDNIFYIVPFSTAELLSQNHGNLVKSSLFRVKHMFIREISELIPDPHVSLMGGLIVGAKQSLGTELQDDFRKTGIIHIVVLSGYNVTIVADAIMRFFSFLPHMFGITLGVISIIFFAILTGASATIVRASIMALLVILARATGRTYAVTRALFIAGFFMVLENPKIVMFDPSFQLSFLATLGLIYVVPLIERHFRLVPTKFQLREFATATVATQIFVLPLLLFMMGELSLVALPVNLLILIFIPVTMLFGFLTGVFGFISSTLAFPFALVSYLLLAYELKVVELFASLPFASVSIPYFPIWLMITVYILYGFIMMRMYKVKV